MVRSGTLPGIVVGGVGGLPGCSSGRGGAVELERGGHVGQGLLRGVVLLEVLLLEVVVMLLLLLLLMMLLLLLLDKSLLVVVQLLGREGAEGKELRDGPFAEFMAHNDGNETEKEKCVVRELVLEFGGDGTRADQSFENHSPRAYVF